MPVVGAFLRLYKRVGIAKVKRKNMIKLTDWRSKSRREDRDQASYCFQWSRMN